MDLLFAILQGILVNSHIHIICANIVCGMSVFCASSWQRDRLTISSPFRIARTSIKLNAFVMRLLHVSLALVGFSVCVGQKRMVNMCMCVGEWVAKLTVHVFHSGRSKFGTPHINCGTKSYELKGKKRVKAMIADQIYTKMNQQQQQICPTAARWIHSQSKANKGRPGRTYHVNLHYTTRIHVSIDERGLLTLF